jgi:dTDP-4-amino-4,6-dideoxygalactose transaminase
VLGILTHEVSACGFKVAESCHRKYGLLVGSGTTALFLACRMTPPGRKKVIVPAIACANVLFAVIYAECTPVFVDICPDTGLLDPSLVCKALEEDPEVGAVLVVHTYGHVANLEIIANYARSRGVLVIEDAAQALGGTYADKRPLGALGDLALVSFGHTKILDAGGGGVLMTDRRDVYEACVAFSAELPVSPVDLENRFANYRSRYYSEWNKPTTDSSSRLGIGRLHQDFRATFLHQADNAMSRRIISALSSLPLRVAERLALAAEYTALLAGSKMVRLCLMTSGSVPWRFVFRVPAVERDALVEHLRRATIDASCWYPCLADFYPNGANDFHLPNADAFAQEVINLWVTPGYDRQKIHDACALIRSFLD